MTGSPLPCALSISDLMYPSATQASSPQEVRQRLIDSSIGSGRSPQNAQLTSMTSSAGRLPNPARAPNPPAANTALSRSVRNLFQIGSVIGVSPPRVVASSRDFLSSSRRRPGPIPPTLRTSQAMAILCGSWPGPCAGGLDPGVRGCNPIQPTESCGEVWSYHASLWSRRTTFEHWQTYVSASGTRGVRQIFPVFSTLAAVGRLDYILLRRGDGGTGDREMHPHRH